MIQRHWNKWIYFGVVMIAGALCGSMLLQTLPTLQQEELHHRMTLYMEWMSQLHVVDQQELFWGVFAKHLKWALAVVLLGISIIGIPVVVVINFLKGFLIGSSIYTLIQTFQEDGVWLMLVTLAPQNIVVIPALIILSSAMITFGGFIFNKRIRKFEGSLKQQLIQLCTVSMAMILLLAVAALIEVYVSPQLLHWYLSKY